MGVYGTGNQKVLGYTGITNNEQRKVMVQPKKTHVNKSRAW